MPERTHRSAAPAPSRVPGSGGRGDAPRFNNPAVTVRSWYVAARSEHVRRNRVRTVEMLNRRIALFRDAAGVAHAFDARCPHLGADLGQGRVCEDGLTCAFHGWTFDTSGACVHAPGHDAPPQRRARRYPVAERWGLVWIFNGETADFGLPGPSCDRRHHTIRFPPQRIGCHPHLVIGNGLDATHMGALHGMRLAADPVLDTGTPGEVTLHVRGRPATRRMQRLTGTTRRPFVASFRAVGGSVAWATVTEPAHFHVLFTGRADADGGCLTQTVGFLHSWHPVYVARAIALFYLLLRDDRRILDTLDFTGRFTEADAGMRAFAACLDRMDVC